MLICGVKASHDGGVAVIDGNRLLFSIEAEKIDNGLRYSPLANLEQVGEILAGEGLDPADVDRFVVDGWWTQDESDPAVVRTHAGGRPLTLPVAPYLDGFAARDPLTRYTFADYDFSGASLGYASYHHASNHLLGAYCSSPFAARGEDALVLVWDGGMAPRLYHVEPRTRSVTTVSVLLPITGGAFADFSAQFDPFRRDVMESDSETQLRHHLSVAGKAMAYAALGTVAESAFPVLEAVMAGFPAISPDNARALGEKIAASRDEMLPGLSNADLIATFQAYLGRLLLRRLTEVVSARYPKKAPHLAMAGGCALNIKWNHALRDSGLFDEIWVPPFPNDSGAALGTACCEMFRESGRWALDWDVYSGPLPTRGREPEGWSVRPCGERQLAEVLHRESEPVVVLSGRAEIGPRALGNRSILAPAVDPRMKDRLNAIKDREGYRPVAPICLSSRASEVFDPGGGDPFMLFEHRMRPGWAKRVPAVVHLDGTARLQTIDVRANSATGRILEAYEQISGIPVLCNTSANLNGHGFFPDVATAARWGRTRYIWSEGRLYTNPCPVLAPDV
ncbi:carbamoyltransferase N-terminal domain-containing protein [Streptomyces ossamyceticus]|uniref:carbamoyltransferase N-terminal domain-containing protein n=1 Tax=Streptomyces ossamyceticus TaxID=249581 RepID=UPI0006E1C0C5|nr:carbamoyltransferase N-terminal domain-containing protein [Streptomyces ossamyceticus]